MTYVTPRDIRPGEFVSSSDFNVLLRDDVIRLFQGVAARVTNVAQSVPPNSDTPLDFGHIVFDRGLHPPGVSDGLHLTEEGVWLTGMQVLWVPNSVASYIGYLKRTFEGEQRGTYYSTFDGLMGKTASGVQTRYNAVGPLYGFAGDVISAAVNQTSGGDLSTDDSTYAQSTSPMLWGLQLSGGRTKETWTTPKRTASSPWLSTDVPTDVQLNSYVRDNLRFLRSRPVALVGANPRNSLALPARTWTNQTLLTRVISDPYGMWSPANADRRLTIPRSGVYLIVAVWGFDFNALGSRAVRIQANIGGSNTVIGGAYTAKPGNARGFALACRNFSANDYVWLQQYSSAAGGIGSHINYGFPLLAAIHISDPATPPAWSTPGVFSRLDANYGFANLNNFGDRLAFLYGPPCVVARRTANQPIGAATWTTANFTLNPDDVNNIGTTLHDPTSGAGTFTLQHDGVYPVCGQIDFTYDGTANGYFVRVLHNGTVVDDVGPYIGLTSNGIDSVIPFMTLLRAKAGDTVQVQVYSKLASTIGNSAGAGACWVAMWRHAA